MADTIQRTLPTKTDDVTHEVIHPSVMYQTIELPQVEANVKANSSLMGTMLPLEEEFKGEWKYVPGQHTLTGDEAKSELANQESEKKILLNMVKKGAASEMRKEVMTDEGGRPRYEESWLGSIIHELVGSG
jgi:hypothetical protein